VPRVPHERILRFWEPEKGNRKAWPWLESSGKGSITPGTLAALRVIFRDFKNVTANEKLLAGGAIGIFPFVSRNVSQVDEPEAYLKTDLPPFFQNTDRSWGKVRKMIMMVKTGHMPGGITSQHIPNPACDLPELIL